MFSHTIWLFLHSSAEWLNLFQKFCNPFLFLFRRFPKKIFFKKIVWNSSWKHPIYYFFRKSLGKYLGICNMNFHEFYSSNQYFLTSQMVKEMLTIFKRWIWCFVSTEKSLAFIPTILLVLGLVILKWLTHCFESHSKKSATFGRLAGTWVSKIRSFQKLLKMP